MSAVMGPRVFGCVLALICVCAVANAQVASLCRPNERLLMCGCLKTCADPAPNCAGSCRPGCYCEEGEVRNDDGLCIKLADCPPNKEAFTLDTTEPRPNNGTCPPNEEYRYCEPCARSCDNPNPICPAQCARGCFCIDGLLRNDKGICVKPEECQITSTPNNSYQEYQMTCNTHQVYKKCETCEKTCSNPNPRCPMACETGCFCEEGYVKAPNGLCVKLEDCPKAEMSIGGPRLFSPIEVLIGGGSPSIEDCAPDEEYFYCGWCEPTCSHLQPICSYKVCITGCLCKPPLVRHQNGRCVEKKDCFPQKCKYLSEEYVCHYGCEPRCEMKRCPLRERHCVFGCHCKFGLYRDGNTGLCVSKEKCINNTITGTSVTNNSSLFNFLDKGIKLTSSIWI